MDTAFGISKPLTKIRPTEGGELKIESMHVSRWLLIRIFNFNVAVSFLPRDAMLCSRPFITLVYCIHTAEDIVKFLVRSGSPIILVFEP